VRTKASLGIHYETYGQGYPLILGFPVTASLRPPAVTSAILTGYLDRLTDRYRVLVMDYPNLGPDIGRSKPIPADELTAERVCSDLLAVADTAKFERFIWWGFSWGGVIGLQLASRSDRVSALVCGAWPPLGGPYADLLRAVRVVAAAQPPKRDVPPDQFVTFYQSVQSWQEAEAVKRIKCPTMTFVGSEDEVLTGGVTVRLAAIIRERRSELEGQGWHVVEITGRDHSLYADPATLVPIVRSFLDRVCR
jgi:pimeloyl-ACP methyl ester carboxylesterase